VKRYTLKTCLIASLLVAGSIAPAWTANDVPLPRPRTVPKVVPLAKPISQSLTTSSATERQFPSPNKTAKGVSPKKKQEQSRNLEIVSVEALTSSEQVLERCFPIVLGVAY
jgi:hypothetical protein